MIPFLCAKIGGIWCYWPTDAQLKEIAFGILILVFLFVLLSQKGKKKEK